MYHSLSAFRFYHSFRIPVEKADNIRFLLEKDINSKQGYVEDAQLTDLSITGLGFTTKENIPVGTIVVISMQYKRYHLDIDGKIVRSFSDTLNSEQISYGVKFDSTNEDSAKINSFIKQYIMGFSSLRLRECLMDSAFGQKFSSSDQCLETFTLLVSLFKDIVNFGSDENFLENILVEAVRLMNAARASIFLINPDVNELQAKVSLGMNKKDLVFDYRFGIAGMVFTTGIPLNLNVENNKGRFNDYFDKKYNFKTKSIICYPIKNNLGKNVGVVEVINKRNEKQFSTEDEKTMKVLIMIMSSIYHNFNPTSKNSSVRNFSYPFNRKDVIIGKAPHVGSLRHSILKIKDIDYPILICGEVGVGKSLYAKILHSESYRGLKKIIYIDCKEGQEQLSKYFFGSSNECKLVECEGGTIVLKDIDKLPLKIQEKLCKIFKDKGVDDKKLTLNVRFIATTSCPNLDEKVASGDLDKNFYRYFSQFLVNIDPLRRRSSDIPELINYFCMTICEKNGYLPKKVSPRLLKRLQNYDWPGNIEELKNCIKRAIVLNPDQSIISDVDLKSTTISYLKNKSLRGFSNIPHVGDSDVPLKDRLAMVERELLYSEIKKCNGNKSKAANKMGISREALRKKLILVEKAFSRLEDKREQETREIKRDVMENGKSEQKKAA